MIDSDGAYVPFVFECGKGDKWKEMDHVVCGIHVVVVSTPYPNAVAGLMRLCRLGRRQPKKVDAPDMTVYPAGDTIATCERKRWKIGCLTQKKKRHRMLMSKLMNACVGLLQSVHTTWSDKATIFWMPR